MIITAIPPDATDDIWLVAEPWIAKAAARTKGNYTPDDVRDLIENGSLVLWMVFDEKGTPLAAFTTRLIRYPRRMSLKIDWAAGYRMREWMHDAMALMERYAKDNGADQIEGGGRVGWKRLGKAFGFEPEYVSMRKDLQDA